MYHAGNTRARKKRKFHAGGHAVETSLGAHKTKKAPTKGGGSKTKLVSGSKVNVTVGGKNTVYEVKDLIDNPANKDFARRRVVTKGAILSVTGPDGQELKVKVSSRTGQDGTLNAVPVTD